MSVSTNTALAAEWRWSADECSPATLGTGGGERVKLGNGFVDAVEAQLVARVQGKVLKALQVVVEDAATLMDKSALRVFEPAGFEIGRGVAAHRALCDENFVAVLAGHIGAAQLETQFRGAAGQDQRGGTGVAVQRLAANRTAVEAKAEWKRDA